MFSRGVYRWPALNSASGTVGNRTNKPQSIAPRKTDLTGHIVDNPLNPSLFEHSHHAAAGVRTPVCDSSLTSTTQQSGSIFFT